MLKHIVAYRYRFRPCDGEQPRSWKLQNHSDTWMSDSDIESDPLTRLETLHTTVKALEAIIERSNNNQLGTSKVMDMRKIAERALKEINHNDAT